jgi:hypothetical protein
MRAPLGYCSLAWVYCLGCITLSTLPACLTAQQQASGAQPDPILGTASLNRSQGEQYEYTLTVRANGTVDYRLMGDSFQGT